jgi:hypothetical protein
LIGYKKVAKLGDLLKAIKDQRESGPKSMAIGKGYLSKPKSVFFAEIGIGDRGTFGRWPGGIRISSRKYGSPFRLILQKNFCF